MDEKREGKEESLGSSSRLPYVKPELRLLGDVLELTKAATGSRADGIAGRAQPSSIRFKSDVSYLDDRSKRAVADQLLQLRLAQWNYREGIEDGARHLGVIVEDSPDILAVTSDKQGIDLYSYASMAIAAAQVQAEEIRCLREELSAMRAELARLREGR